MRPSCVKLDINSLHAWAEAGNVFADTEAQGIRDAWQEMSAAGITVIGVSTQDAASHQHFIEKEKLPFDLAVDVGGAVAKAFHVPLKGELASRQTFLIGADGKLKKVWEKVTPAGHAQEILAAAK